MKKIIDVPNICFTGGPCGGKTTILAASTDSLISKGFYPFVVQEAATIMIGGNVKPDNPHLQKAIFKTQMHLFKTFNAAAKHVINPVVLHDRGALDNRAYISEEEFRKLIAPRRLEHLRDSQFKAIIDLETAANGAEEFYTLENNKARTESPEEARALDVRLQQAWNGHPKFIMIENKGISFEEKKDRAVGALLGVLGFPVPIEDEQKYLIDPSFDVSMIPKNIHVVDSPIVQDYIVSLSKDSERVRMRGIQDCEIYFHTIKRSIPGSTANIEEEKVISKSLYRELLSRKLPLTTTIRKMRYTFLFENNYFELDVFLNKLNGLMLLEIEKTVEGREIVLPDFLEKYILKEVTGDPRYSNAQLARYGLQK
ncbi:MAG TPA: AAA family ATPase [Candidatus Paceibacterota bacterium]|jgi:CYTH domain-containing protein|nr:AAA family ATPase [Candidatus Paceibacterota bacterium]